MPKGKNANARVGKKATRRQSDPEAGSKEAGVPPTRQTGPESATGQAIRDANGEQEIPKGEERGSQVEIQGGDPKATLEGGDKPRGMQAKPAIFSSNGEIPRNAVPTASGLVPVSTVANTQEEADAIVEKREEDHKRYVERTVDKHEELDAATVGRLGRAELRAIGEQRGYEMPEAGTRATRAAFLNGQSKDELIGSGRGAERSGAKTSNRSMERSTKAAAPKGAKSARTRRS